MGSLSFFLVVTILVVLFSIAYSKPLQYRFPIVVLCSSSSASSTGSTLLNISCNFRSSRKENLTNCGEASSFNFTLVPAGSSSISYCVSFNDLRNVTTFDSYGVMELVSPVAAQSIDAVVLLSEMPKMSNIPSLDVYSDFIYTASASLIVNVLQRPSDQVKSYLVETRPLAKSLPTIWIEYDPRYFAAIEAETNSYFWGLLVEPATWLMLLAALLTIWYGSYRSTQFYEQFREALQLDQNNVVESKTAFLLPIGGSLMLLLLFFFLDWLYILLVILMTFSAVVSACYVMWPYVASVPAKLHMKESYDFLPGKIDPIPGQLLVAFPIAAVVAIVWLITKFWLLTDLLALCIGVTALSYLRLPDLKISALILVLFFFYDIFWVFVSTLFTKSGESVMVSVAMGLPQLPVVILIPRILSDGFDLLGMGDIILPGIFLCFLYRYDTNHDGVAPSYSRASYFRVGMIGYAAGFTLTFVALIAMQMGQPALLYLVPCTLIPVTVRAIWLGDFGSLWHGRMRSDGAAAASRDADLEAGQSLVVNDAQGQFEIDDGTTTATTTADTSKNAAVTILPTGSGELGTRNRTMGSPSLLTRVDDTNISTTHSEGTIIGMPRLSSK